MEKTTASLTDAFQELQEQNRALAASLRQAEQRAYDLQARIDRLPAVSEINPLIDEDGDTVLVKSVLGFLANVFCMSEPGNGIPLSFDQSCGLSHLLRACIAAMDEMEHPSYRKGGAA